MSLFKKIYGGRWSVSKSQPILEADARIKSGVVVEGKHGLQVCFTFQDGESTAYAVLSKNSELQADEEFPVATGRALTLSKDGADDVMRVIEK